MEKIVLGWRDILQADNERMSLAYITAGNAVNITFSLVKRKNPQTEKITRDIFSIQTPGQIIMTNLKKKRRSSVSTAQPLCQTEIMCAPTFERLADRVSLSPVTLDASADTIRSSTVPYNML